MNDVIMNLHKIGTLAVAWDEAPLSKSSIATCWLS